MLVSRAGLTRVNVQEQSGTHWGVGGGTAGLFMVMGGRRQVRRAGDLTVHTLHKYEVPLALGHPHLSLIQQNALSPHFVPAVLRTSEVRH